MSGKSIHSKAGCALLASLAIGIVHGASLYGTEQMAGAAAFTAGAQRAVEPQERDCAVPHGTAHGRAWASARESLVAANVAVLVIVVTWSWRGGRARQRNDEAGQACEAREREMDRILHLARHDGLTGLPNRGATGEHIEEALRHAARTGQEVMVAFLDLDGFKHVNDTLGHAAGDELLQTVASRMAGCLRGSDMVGRYGGDEFVLVLPLGGTAAAGRAALLEKVLGAVARPVLLEGREVQVSCSIGAALYPRDGADRHALLASADAAMYRAKKMGKNNCQFHRPA